tara:strand:- start:9 stop:698 length:690 start_codon:yes stop_codon:yes gene_type:complete
LPDISKINNVEVANISKLDSITFADGQKVNNQSVSLVTDAHTFIRAETVDPSSPPSSINFLDGTSSVVMDSTYDIYEWHFIGIHPATDHVNFQVQFNASGGSGYNETITSSVTEQYMREDGGNYSLTYRDSIDQAQGTSYQSLTRETSNDNDSSVNGILTLYAPSGATYVKHFTTFVNDMQNQDSYDAYARGTQTAGYINTTSAVDEVEFKFDSGNIAAGEIRMYGVKG